MNVASFEVYGTPGEAGRGTGSDHQDGRLPQRGFGMISHEREDDTAALKLTTKVPARVTVTNVADFEDIGSAKALIERPSGQVAQFLDLSDVRQAVGDRFH